MLIDNDAFMKTTETKLFSELLCGAFFIFQKIFDKPSIRFVKGSFKP
jgi:hypothetical protein